MYGRNPVTMVNVKNIKAEYFDMVLIDFDLNALLFIISESAVNVRKIILQRSSILFILLGEIHSRIFLLFL